MIVTRKADERGTRTLIDYVLATAIISLILAGSVSVYTQNFVNDQQQRISRTELLVVSERISGQLEEASRVSERRPEYYTKRVEAQQFIAGSRYSIRIEEESTNLYTLSLQSGETSVETQFRSQVKISEKTLNGGDILIEYDRSSHEIRLSKP